jgi:putative SOS response-associated peptidase YedK
MCGRFTLAYKTKELQLALGLPEVNLDWQLRYNIAPSQPVAAILNSAPDKIEFLRWGLVPGWAKDIEIGNRLINARSETVMEKPSFKNAFARRRCIIFADGFYEWRKPTVRGKSSQPFYFYLKDKQPFALAGLWEIWHSPQGDELWSTTIITCDANSVLKPIHPRMPVILDKENMFHWLDDQPQQQLIDMMKPYPAEKMDFHMVSKAVNSPFNETEDCIKKISPRSGFFG